MRSPSLSQLYTLHLIGKSTIRAPSINKLLRAMSRNFAPRAECPTVHDFEVICSGAGAILQNRQ